MVESFLSHETSMKVVPKKKSSGDDSNKQNVDQKPGIKVEVSEANEGESVPNVSEEESNRKETDKISENGINGTKKVDEKDVKAEEKPLVETYKKNEDVSHENPKRTYHRLATSLCTESVTRAKKSKEAILKPVSGTGLVQYAVRQMSTGANKFQGVRRDPMTKDMVTEEGVENTKWKGMILIQRFTSWST